MDAAVGKQIAECRQEAPGFLAVCFTWPQYASNRHETVVSAQPTQAGK
jgi:hypothetical protein